MQQSFYLTARNQHTIDSLQNTIKSASEDTIKLAAFISLSDQFKDSNSDRAIEYAQQALALAIKLDNQKSVGRIHNKLGDLYWYKGDYGSSSEHYFEAITIFEKLNDKASIADCYRNIGWIYFYQENYNQSLIQYFKALDINTGLNRGKEIAENYNDIGLVYIEQKKYKEAIDNYNSALKIQIEIGNKQGISANFGNLSTVYGKLGKLDLAIAYNEKSINIAKEIGNKRYLADSYCNHGEFFIKSKRYNEAIFFLHRSINYAKGLNDKIRLKDCYGKLLTVFALQNDYQKALIYIQLSSALTDSLNNDNNSRLANEITAKYESEKKELMINNLEKGKALSERKLQREKNFINFIIIFVVIIFVFVFVLFRGNAQKRKANIALSIAYKEIELKSKEITDSINYSQRIQEASLSPKELKYKLFPDAFVLFKPKDIVSGDFYWFSEKNGKSLIASCDCTGHGVPGALMSMIGNNILNQIVHEKGITSPDEILNLLHKEIRRSFKQEEQNGAKDGMDIALISFISETEIEYAGAQRPLWIIKETPPNLPFGEEKEAHLSPPEGRGYQRTSPAGDIAGSISSPLGRLGGASTFIEIKADKFSIGGLQSETERKFTKHRISVSKGDCLYIFSDGIVDQFGGREGKKFMSKRFKDLLLLNNKKPMLEQETIICEKLAAWKGSREQVDDILVIGIKA